MMGFGALAIVLAIGAVQTHERWLFFLAVGTAVMSVLWDRS